MGEQGAERALEVKLSFDVKTYDIDFAGIVSNIVYIRWLEDMRLAILAAHLPISAQIQSGIGPAIIKTEIQYKRPLTIHDEVEGRMWVESVGKARYFLAAEFTTGDTTAAVAKQEGCFFGLERKRPISLPAVLVEAYERSVG